MKEYSEWTGYFLDIAGVVSNRSSCSRRQIGAVLTSAEHEIISTGYNGTPRGTMNCNEGGCSRCWNESIKSGDGYDYCTCIHAEHNALLSCARQGKAAVGSTMYVTDIPCLQCLTFIVQCGVKTIIHGIDEFDGVRVSSKSEHIHRIVGEGNVEVYKYNSLDKQISRSSAYYPDWRLVN